PSWITRKPEIPNLSRLHEVVQSRHHLFDWRDRIPGMQPVEIDVVGLKSFQRAFHRAINILASIAASIWIAWHTIESKLCCQHYSISQTTLSDELAQQLLAVSFGVDISGVDEVSARVEVAIKN